MSIGVFNGDSTEETNSYYESIDLISGKHMLNKQELLENSKIGININNITYSQEIIGTTSSILNEVGLLIRLNNRNLI